MSWNIDGQKRKKNQNCQIWRNGRVEIGLWHGFGAM